MPPIFQVLAVVLAGWLNRHQQPILDFLRVENRVLKAQLRGRRLRLTDDDRRRLAVRLVREKLPWGHDRIVGALATLGHHVAPTTIRNILQKHGIDPAPERRYRTSWRTFLRTRFSSIAAGDLFTTEVWTARGLVTWYTNFVIDRATRAVEIAGSTPNSDDEFMKQVARNLTDCVDGFLAKKPGRMIFFGAGSLRHALSEYVAHCNTERTHRRIGNRLIRPRPTSGSTNVAVRRTQRLGGLLNFYECRAA